jgi:hypothetical protein
MGRNEGCAVGLTVMLALSACTPTPKPEQWKIWNASQIAAVAARDDSSAALGATGIRARDLATVPKVGAPFRGTKYADPAPLLPVGGPAILPAFAERGTAAYFVTEVWQNAPKARVQPVYVWVSALAPNAPPSARLTLSSDPDDLVPTVFGVGPNSAFTSPFWQAHFVVPKEGETIGFDTATDVSEVLAHTGKSYDGPLVGCPILPEGVAFVGDRGVRPLSLEPVKALTPVSADGIRNAWVDQEIVKYVDLGPGTFQVDDAGEVVTTRLYSFVTGDVDAPTRVPVPAVLAADAKQNTLAERVDVWLNPAEMEVFVPAGAEWNEVREELRGLGFGVPTPGASIPAALEPFLRLRVAKRAPSMTATQHCFDSFSSFSGPCYWLDSEAAINTRLEGRQLFTTNTRMSVWPLLFNGAFP